MDDDDAAVPAAAQISQADIIERQAETIARLKRQVQKGTEYKQLTKSKLKEAAARLKEYRLRVETLLQAEETLKRQLKEEEINHEKTKKRHKTALQKAKKQVLPKTNVATQTETTTKMTRTCQTTLSGQVEKVNKRTMVGKGVQMEDVFTTRKRGREHVASSVSAEMDQFVPKLSRQLEKSVSKDTSTPAELIQVLGGQDGTFLHETSAALDAELAFSDADEDSADTLEIDDIEAGAAGGESVGLVGFDATVTSEIDKELEMSSDEEDGQRGAGGSLLGGFDAAVQNEIDKELETSSDEEEVDKMGDTGTGRADKARTSAADESRTRAGRATIARTAQFGGFSSAISDAIDKDLESSSDDEEDKAKNAKPTGLVNRVSGDVAGVTQIKPALMSIDDELDDEFAALDSDSEQEHGEKKSASGNKDDSSSSSSSDSDSSDSSDSDSNEAGDDPMNGKAGTAPVQIADKASLGPEAENDAANTAIRQSEGETERGSPTTGKDTVVLTTPGEKKPVTAIEDMYSPIVEAELPSQAPVTLQLDTSAVTGTRRDGTGDSSVPIVAPPVQERITKSTQPSDNADKDENGAVLTTITGTQASLDTPRLPVSKAPEPVASSIDTIKVTEHSGDTASNPREVVLSPISTVSEPGEQLPPSDALEAGIPAPKKQSIVGKTRNAEEANLDEFQTQTTSQKKVKVDEVSELVEEGAAGKLPAGTEKLKKKPALQVETQEERQMKKSLTIFKQALILDEGEEADNEYARRTISVLVSQSSKFIDAHVAHVTTLCQVLADAYRKLVVSPMAVVRGALGVFRTPRSRRLMQESKLGLSWLCNQVLIWLLSIGDGAQTKDTPDLLSMSLVDECLLHLQKFLVEERKNIGNVLSTTKVQAQVATQQINVSHDKMFLAHICALHTHICKSTGQLARSRVLLFDLVRTNPNIRGLYFAMVMLDVYPAILEREFDQHCVERSVMLKEVLQRVLTVVAGVAGAREELLLHQSSVTMLHRIAEAIQMPELEDVDGSDPFLPKSCVEKLFDKLTASSRPSNSEDKSQDGIDYFELGKSLEVYTAAFGHDLVTQIFSIDRYQELFSNADVDAKCGIISVAGHVAKTIASNTKDTQNPKTRSEQYVENAIDWFYQILSSEMTDEKASTEDRFQLLARCSTVCVELILEYSAAAELDSRRRVLCAVVEWFDATPSDQLIDLSATFLRRLRLAVVVARPQVAPVAV